MSKVIHILKEVSQGIAHTASAALNTIAFDGDMYTSTSARCHMETHDEEGNLRPNAPAQWLNRRKFVNSLFFWQEDHCKGAWEADYDRALNKFFANINI
jgi:hypothetical protein